MQTRLDQVIAENGVGIYLDANGRGTKFRAYIYRSGEGAGGPA